MVQRNCGLRNELSAKPRVALRKGDWLDVMDSDGVWNVAQVLSVPSSDEVEITYDGWPEEYNEVVCLNSDRVAPYNTFTWTVKCWVKYLNWPLWPSLITIRTPGTTEGINNLAAENRLFVDFLDDPSFAKRDRCWQKKSHVQSFEENYDKKRVGSTGDNFERALEWVLQSNASSKLPKFSGGTLPMKYKSIPTKSVEKVRRKMGDELWFSTFNENRKRHKMNHVYETMTDEENDNPNNLSFSPRPSERYLNLSAANDSQSVFNETERSASIRIEHKPHVKSEVSDELESTDSSSDSEVENEQEGRRPKRKRLQTTRRSNISKKAGQQILRRPIGSKILKSVPVTAGARLNSCQKDGVQKVPFVGTTDSLADYNTMRIKREDSGANVKHHLKLDDSMRLERVTKLETTTTKKILAQGQHLPSKDVSRNERVKQIRQNSSLSSHNGFQPISSCVTQKDLRQAMQSNLESPQRASEIRGLAQPKGNIQHEGKATEHKRKRSIQLFISNDISSDGMVSEDISDNVTVSESIQEHRIQEVEANDFGGVGGCVEHNHLDWEANSDRVDYCTQELRRRFCVMQADQEDADASEKVKSSTKTVISVPRKFQEVSVRAPSCCTSLLNRVTSPPRLLSLTSEGRTGAALAAPSTSVFSSSKGFSMRSWFKRKMMSEFINGEK